jgi:hypothetical protein
MPLPLAGDFTPDFSSQIGRIWKIVDAFGTPAPTKSPTTTTVTKPPTAPAASSAMGLAPRFMTKSSVVALGLFHLLAFAF